MSLKFLEAILPFLRQGAVFWDIGANFGLHAITAKHLKPEARVICIEPSPIMIARLNANARLNNVSVDIINAALSDSRGFRQSLSGGRQLGHDNSQTFGNRQLCRQGALLV